MSENQNSLRKYYDGVTRRLQIEFEFLNGIIGHNLERGEANELLLTNLLIKFLPKKYSVGSGMVIDRNGCLSKQVDIIIYDSYFQPDLFSQISTVLYPVDVVYMTIEVKSLLNKTTMREAIENVQSVKRLEIIPSTIIEQPTAEEGRDSISFIRTYTSPPLGVIFGFRSDTSNHATFENWITEPRVPPAEIFDLCYAMNHTFFYTFLDSDNKNEARTGVYPQFQSVERIGEDYENVADYVKFSNDSYPIVQFRGHDRVVDPGGGFLNFLSNVYDLLSLKSIIRRGILRNYLENNMFIESSPRNYNLGN